jgi:hypothetical protein
LAAGVVVLDANIVSMLAQATNTTLTFNGTVPISPNEVFLLSGSAYIASAVNSVNGQTVVAVAAPTINQVFGKVDLAGTYMLDASQVVAQSAAIKEQIKSLSVAHPEASVGVSYPWNYTNGPLSISGSGSLQLQAVPNIHYTSANGFANTSIEFDALASAQASLNVTAAETLPWTTFVNVGNYRIPIPLTVVDGLLNLIGVNAASIYVPVNIGGSLSASLAATYSANAQESGGILVTVGADGTVSGSTTAGLGSNTLSFLAPAASPSSSTAVLESLGFGAFTGVELQPQLLLLNTVAAFGVDMKVGPQLSATLEVLPAGNSPPLCGNYSGQITLQANAFYLGLTGQSIWPSTGAQSFDLYDIGTAPLGASCSPQPSVTATPQGSGILFTSLTVSVVVTPPSSGVASGTPPPTGQVKISLDGDQCLATIDSSGAGTCSVTPSQAGTRSLGYQYSGDSNYQASAPASQPLDVALAQVLVTLAGTPNPVIVGNTTTFTFVLSPSPDNGTNPLPTGTVSVVDETSTPLCSADVGTTATGSCTYAYSSAGTHSLTAVYGGDGHYVAKHSAIYTLAMNSVILQISPASPSVIVGSTTTLTVTASDASGSVPPPSNLQWASSNSAIATVANGVVTGVATGSATITVTDPVSNATASAAVTVTVEQRHNYQYQYTGLPFTQYVSCVSAVGPCSNLPCTSACITGPISATANFYVAADYTGVLNVSADVEIVNLSVSVGGYGALPPALLSNLSIAKAIFSFKNGNMAAWYIDLFWYVPSANNPSIFIINDPALVPDAGDRAEVGGQNVFNVTPGTWTRVGPLP